jgi:hypothetical protein
MKENTVSDKRFEHIQAQILGYILKDFSMRSPISDKGDEVDAIIAGLNTLGEEMQSGS